MSAQIHTEFNVKLSKHAPFDVVAEATTLIFNTSGGSISIKFEDVDTMVKLGDAIKDGIERNEKRSKKVDYESMSGGSHRSDGDEDDDDHDDDEEDDLIGAIANMKFGSNNDDSFDADEVVETQQLC